MTNKKATHEIRVSSEITKLKQLLIHSPGGEMNNMLPNKRDEWLIDDILETKIIQEEYQEFAKTLLLFLDPIKILEGKSINPSDKNFHKSDVVIDAQYKLAQLFADTKNEKKTLALIEHVAALEKLHFKIKVDLIKLYEAAKTDYRKNKELVGSKFMSLVKTLITGKLFWRWKRKNSTEWELKSIEDNPLFVLKPIPNFIFTRDIGVTLNEHFLITKTANEIRHREVVLMKYITECFLFKGEDENDYSEILERVIEISEDSDYFQYDSKEMEKKKVNFEGGDIMMVSKRHLLIGKSQRTSIEAINKLIHRLFKKNIGIEIISVIQIAEKRSQMHIDTIMTHVREDVWMLYGRLSKKVMDAELEADNAIFSHNDILEVKGEVTKLSRENEFVTVQQFYCKSGDYKKAEKTSRDFHVYTKDDLEELYKDVIKKLDIKIDNLTSYDKERRKEYQAKFIYDMLPDGMKYTKPKDVESLLREISQIEFGVKGEVRFVYSGNEQYPFDEREQWTDGCNLLSIGNGVVIGYDRNRETAKRFEKEMSAVNSSKAPESNKKIHDFVKAKIKAEREERESKAKISGIELAEEKKEKIMMYCVTGKNLLQYISENCKTEKEITAFTSDLKDLLITIPSGELSRARGGSHCMSMPLLREK